MRGAGRAAVWSLAVLLAASCSGGDEGSVDTGPSADAPSSGEALRLRLGTVDPPEHPDGPVVEAFAEQVEELSGGSIEIEIEWEAAGPVNDFERVTAEMVQQGDLDLGWTGARVFDTLGVTSFQALQAPFLIQDPQHLNEVLTSPMVDEMLAGLDAAELVGLGLYPDQLRHPLGFRQELVTPSDFEGATIRVPTSNASDALMRALGAEPVHLNGPDYEEAIATGKLDGVDASVGLAPSLGGAIVTSNIVFYPRVNTLFANPVAYEALTSEQREMISMAAARTFDVAVERTPRHVSVQEFCDGGGWVVTASEADLAAFDGAVRPVYMMMERDPQTAAFIDEIRALKRPGSLEQIPASCEG